MPIASFGPKVFTVSQNKIYTFDNYNRTSSLEIEEQEVPGLKPSTYIKGPGLDEISLLIPLVKQNGLDIRYEILSWIGLKDLKTPHHLIIGDKPVSYYKFVVVGVTEQESVFDNKGEYLRTKIEVKFKEFARYGSKSDSAGTKSSSKKTKKRTNKNVAISKADLDKLLN